MLISNSLRLIFATFAVSFAAPSAILAAQSPLPPSVQDLAQAQVQALEYTDLLESMQSAVDEGVVMESALNAMRQQFAVDPSFSTLEAASPGFIDEVIEGMRPILTAHSKRVGELYLPQMTDALSRHLTPEEARVAAEFYRSDLGRRLMKTASGNYSPEAALDGFSDSGEVTQQDLDRDLDRTVTETMQDLTPEEQAALGREFLANPALLKMNAAQVDVRSVRVAMENEPLTPQAERDIDSMIGAIFKRRFPDG